MGELRIWIPGKPIPLARARARAFVRGGRAVPVIYHPQGRELEAFRLAVMSKCPVGHTAYLGAVSIWAQFHFEVPKSDSKKIRDAKLSGEIPHTHKPDVSNLLKWIEDACNGILWRDDRQVWQITILKQYAPVAGTELVVWEV